MATCVPPSPSGWPEGGPSPAAVTDRGASPGGASPGGAAPSGARPAVTRLSPAGRLGGYLGGRDGDVQEVERVLSHVAVARDRAEQARRVLLRTHAERELIEALAESEEYLREAQRRLILGLDAGAPGPLATA